ncbi:hypothetical protein FA10DRAFT_266595 [Acaromyces ingoldii]|uniref:Uncharacterized protein n=1 Tax=Acaromyces ingoldii TaxID=215250 RepID=A0A316YMQ0_9BASI|nr:hypothetical protein FA10DRAFT_266595 [Acaromyces ingoldii]PWN90084.1 hypothetical protein FA10DRAFT_266595 [Acaromyces ingoldii]
MEKKAYFGSHSSGSSGGRSSSSGSRSSNTYFGSSSSHHNGSKSTQGSSVLGYALLVGLSTTAASLWTSF